MRFMLIVKADKDSEAGILPSQELLKRAPFQEAVVEIRQVFEADDFGPAFTPELREAEERLRAKVSTTK
jgi:hypothetical protein